MNTLKNWRRWLYLISIVSGGCILSFATQAANASEISAEQQAALYPTTARYTIRRKGKKVGKHLVNFSQNDSELKVYVESKITITILNVPVFKFEYIATEQWNNGRLKTVKARTNNGGDITKAEYAPSSNEAVAFSSNHWNADVLSATEVFNTLTGNISQVSVDMIGSETLEDDSISINANRYRYTGDIQANIWYDDAKRWVKLEFKGEDGSVISYTANPLNFAQ